MKRRLITTLLAGVIITGLGTAAFASAPIKIIYNGEVLKTDVPLINQNGRVLAPVRSIAEAMGATVTWDKRTNSVMIHSQEKEKDSMRISNLEAALAPKTQLDVVNSWAEGVKTRNGAWQYAVMTPEMKKLHYEELDSLNWVTGTSSPWIKEYKVTELFQVNDTTYRYSVEFTWTDSTNSSTKSIEYVTVTNTDGVWLVASLDNLDIKGGVTQIERNDNNQIKNIFVENKASNTIGYDKATAIIGKETKVYLGYTNQELKVEDIKVGSSIEVTFEEGPMIMIYPPQAVAKTIRVFYSC